MMGKSSLGEGWGLGAWVFGEGLLNVGLFQVCKGD